METMNSIKEFDFSEELKDYVDNISNYISKHSDLSEQEINELLCYVSRAGYKVGLNTPETRKPEWAYNVCPYLKEHRNYD